MYPSGERLWTDSIKPLLQEVVASPILPEAIRIISANPNQLTLAHRVALLTELEWQAQKEYIGNRFPEFPRGMMDWAAKPGKLISLTSEHNLLAPQQTPVERFVAPYAQRTTDLLSIDPTGLMLMDILSRNLGFLALDDEAPGFSTKRDLIDLGITRHRNFVSVLKP